MWAGWLYRRERSASLTTHKGCLLFVQMHSARASFLRIAHCLSSCLPAPVDGGGGRCHAHWQQLAYFASRGAFSSQRTLKKKDKNGWACEMQAPPRGPPAPLHRGGNHFLFYVSWRRRPRASFFGTCDRHSTLGEADRPRNGIAVVSRIVVLCACMRASIKSIASSWDLNFPSPKANTNAAQARVGLDKRSPNHHKGTLTRAVFYQTLWAAHPCPPTGGRRVRQMHMGPRVRMFAFDESTALAAGHCFLHVRYIATPRQANGTKTGFVQEMASCS